MLVAKFIKFVSSEIIKYLTPIQGNYMIRKYRSRYLLSGKSSVLKNINMKLLFILFAPLLVSLSSCNNPFRDNPPQATQDDYEIIKATFELLESNPPPSISGYETEEMEEPEEVEAFNYEVLPDEAFEKIYFTDKLIAPKKMMAFPDEKKYIKYYSDTFKDLEYNQMLLSVVRSKQVDAILELDKIKNIGLHKLVPLPYRNDKNIEMGDSQITYSTISYNRDRNKACFYFEDRCSGLCGRGILVAVKKVRGTWKIVEEHEVWVS